MKTMKIGLVALLVAFAVLMAAAPVAAHHPPHECDTEHPTGTCPGGQTCQVTGQECQMVWGPAESGKCPGGHSSETCDQDWTLFGYHHHLLVEECNDEYGCVLTSCPAGQHIDGETCVPDVCGVDYCTDVGVHHCEDSECILDTCGDDFCNDSEDSLVCPQDCGCPEGLQLCDENTCCDLQADPANCGECGNVCFATQTCSEGNCRFNSAGEVCYTDQIFGALRPLDCGGLGDADPINLNSVDGEPLYVTVAHWGGSFSCELTEHQGESEYSYLDACEAVDYYHNGCDVQRLCVGTVASFTTTGSRDFRIKCAPNNINDNQPFSIQVIDHFVDYSGTSDGRILDLRFMRTPDLQGCR